PSYRIDPAVPIGLAELARPAFEGGGLVAGDTPEIASASMIVNPGANAAAQMEWTYALVGPFATVPDDVALTDLQAYWNGTAAGLPDFANPPQWVLTADVRAWLAATWGEPAVSVLVDSPDTLVDSLWNTRPSVGLIPFHQLSPRLKVLTVDGQSVLTRDVDLSAYPFKLSVGVVGSDDQGLQIANNLAMNATIPPTNRDPSRISDVTMTGVTALVRATAWHMNLYGFDYPSFEIMPFLQTADILHTSNEVAFWEDCPDPELYGDLQFCSQPKTVQLLETIGLDVVELTGNHVNDFGIEPLGYSMLMYDNREIVYFGGGRTTEEAQTPRILTTPDGTRVAFVGCNAVGPATAWATIETPGAANCGDWMWIETVIQTLKAENQADLVIATVQHRERQSYIPDPAEIADYERLAIAGADIVAGTSSHVPQGFGFAGDGFVHYGLGNLFFDQMDFIENRQLFADKHILYEGRHISTVLFTGMMENWSQPRPMTPEERAEFLQLIFDVSSW
ncbi:MAG: hypothetical protein GYB68_02720, partial [Chloroflexi bacterium]|nr:hypothetical protein [Chloroflexota bacterium]